MRFNVLPEFLNWFLFPVLHFALQNTTMVAVEVATITARMLARRETFTSPALRELSNDTEIQTAYMVISFRMKHCLVVNQKLGCLLNVRTRKSAYYLTILFKKNSLFILLNNLHPLCVILFT